MRSVRAKKGLGQHFLIDLNIARQIVEGVIPGNYNTLIEIGPGKGVLTDIIFEQDNTNFSTVELDTESIDYLNVKYPEHTEKFVYGDILKYDLSVHKAPIALVGNLPYFISSQIFFKALDNRDSVNQMVFMIQKESQEKNGNSSWNLKM